MIVSNVGEPLQWITHLFFIHQFTTQFNNLSHTFLKSENVREKNLSLLNARIFNSQIKPGTNNISNQSINQTVFNVLISMLAPVGRLDPQQLLHLSLSNSSPLCIPYVLISIELEKETVGCERVHDSWWWLNVLKNKVNTVLGIYIGLKGHELLVKLESRQFFTII